jgi:hypothetical protein
MPDAPYWTLIVPIRRSRYRRLPFDLAAWLLPPSNQTGTGNAEVELMRTAGSVRRGWLQDLLLGLGFAVLAAAAGRTGAAAAGLDPAPTLARLAFWVPPEHQPQLAGQYEEQLVPVLRQHGLVPVPEPGRATPDSVFSRLLSLAEPGALAEARTGLEQDPAWQQALASCAKALSWHPRA